MRYISEDEARQRYDDMLDEIYGDFMDAYPASRVLKAVDPIAYRVGFSDFEGTTLYEEGLTTDESRADEDEDDEE